MDSLTIIYAAGGVMLLGVAALGFDTLLTRICPDCGSPCRRVHSDDNKGKVYVCRYCRVYLVGRKPRS